MKVYIALADAGGGYVWNTKEGINAMKIYLAGAATGNNNAIWRANKKTPKEAMKIFLAGTKGHQYCIQDIQTEQEQKDMKVYMAAYSTPFGGDSAREAEKQMRKENTQNICVLESFYYMQDWMKPYIREHWDFLLDSGAFTFMGNNDTNEIDWNAYLTKYIDFINEMDIDHFLELDIDSVVGIKKVEELRARLEKETGKKSIPVWHPSRSLNYYHKMVEDYDYVALSLSGKYTSRWIRNSGGLNVISKLLDIAKKQNCKVHGLGYTKLNHLPKLKFHSVDSTAWIYGNRGGYLYQFNGKSIDKINKPKGKRLKSRAVAIHNFKEWVKFQKYAINNL